MAISAGAILLIAAKRSDQVASELAEHDYEQDCRSEKMLEQLSTEFATLKKQHEDLHRHMNAVMAALNCAPPRDAGEEVFDGAAAEGASAKGTPGDA